MPEVAITESAITAFATTVALIVPLFIIAILVDSSKSAQRIGPVNSDKQADKASIRQSRRTLLAIGVGVVVEVNSLLAILTAPSDSSGPVPVVNYAYVIFNGAGILALFYVIFIPHIELHVSNIRKDPATARWTVIVGWLVAVGLMIIAVEGLFISSTEVYHILGYISLGIALIFTGSMITLTLNLILRGRLKEHSVTERKAETANRSDSMPNA